MKKEGNHEEGYKGTNWAEAFSTGVQAVAIVLIIFILAKCTTGTI